MAVKTEEVEKNLSKITFEVSAEEFSKAVDRVYKKNAPKFNILTTVPTNMSPTSGS